MLRCIALTFALLASLATATRGQPAPPPQDDLTVSILTFGPGPLVFERFGHIAVRVQSPSRGLDVAYDWGNFSFDDPGFITRFVRGDMRYWMQGKSTRAMLDAYVGWADRTVVEYRLNLDAPQTAKLLASLARQDTDTARFYRYDYYLDNCSTRVRDLLDEATDGALRASLSAPTAASYRDHTRRLLWVGIDNQVLATLIDFCSGLRVDAPLSQWDAAFLPMELGRQLERLSLRNASGHEVSLVAERIVHNTTTSPGNAEPANAGPIAWPATMVGVAGAIVLVLLSRWWPLGFTIGAAVWECWTLFASAFLLLVVCFTQHWVTAWNVNLLQFTPLALHVLMSLVWPREARLLRAAAGVALGLSVTGAIVTMLGLTPQRAMPAIGLSLPLHAAVWWGLRRRYVLAPRSQPEGTS